MLLVSVAKVEPYIANGARCWCRVSVEGGRGLNRSDAASVGLEICLDVPSGIWNWRVGNLRC